MLDRTQAAERRGDSDGFGTTRCRAGPGHDRDLVEHHGGVLDEHRVGQIGRRLEPLDREPQPLEHALVRGVLADSQVDINRHTSHVGELAVRHGGAYSAGESDRHDSEHS